MGRDDADGFPVFGNKQLRQFYASPHAMRIAERSTFRYLAVNDAAVELYGYTREEFLKLTLKDTRHPEEHAELGATFAAHTGCFRYSGVRRHIKKSGEIFYVEVVTQDILFDGRPARLSLTVDVTRRLHTQELLWRRQQEFESLAENLPDLVARFDRDHRYAYVNSAVERLTGKCRAEIIGRTQRELGMPGEVIAAFEGSFAGAFSAGEVHTLEFRFPAVEGERLFEAFHVPERDATGEIATVLCIARDITRRKRSERLLRQREKEFETLAENLPDIVVRFDREIRHIYVNAAVERLTGLPRSAFIGKTHFEIPLPREKAELFDRSMKEVFEIGRANSIEFSFDTPAGERYFEAHHIPEFGSNGEVVTALCIGHDITERKRVERELRETNEFLRSVIGSSRDCIKVLDLEGRLESMSLGGQRLMEIDDIQPLLKKSWIEFWKDADREAATRALDAARGGGTGSFEGYCPTVKGEPRWWDVMVSPILDAAGRPHRLLAVSRDITGRREIHDKLRESEGRFRQLAENIRQVFWIATPDHDKMVYISPAYEEIWGKSRDTLFRDPLDWMQSIHPEDLPLVSKGLERVARGESLDAEYRILRPDGTLRWIRDRSYFMKAGDGSPLACGLAEDITRSKLAEQDRLTHAVQQRDALVREVHHRIKNSLQGVVGLLRQKVRKYPAIAPGIEEAIAQVQSVALVYGLQETRPDGLIALSEIMNEVCASAEGLTGGTVEKARERKSRRPACVAGAEAVSVAVALNELVFNALKHQAGTGRKRARVTLLESKDLAEIRIANRGKLPKGFDYLTGHGVGQGLGLVRTLLAPPGGDVAFNGGHNEVEVIVTLVPPLLALRQQAVAR